MCERKRAPERLISDIILLAAVNCMEVEVYNFTRSLLREDELYCIITVRVRLTECDTFKEPKTLVFLTKKQIYAMYIR